MTEYTTYYQLNKPTFDFDPWNDLLNDNFDAIDAALHSFFSLASFVGSWRINTHYGVGTRVFDDVTPSVWECVVDHTSGTGTFLADRTAHPAYWTPIGAITAAASGVTYTPSGWLTVTTVQDAIDAIVAGDILRNQVFS